MKIKYLFFVVFFLIFIKVTNSQIQKASINSDFTINTTNIDTKSKIKSYKTSQLASWPKSFESNASFKNMRGVCLEDIDNNGDDEILFATNDSLHVYTGTGIKLWAVKLQGTAIYPPSTADINNDNEIEIVQITGGVPANGHIHIFDKDGNSLDGWPQSLDNNWLICAPALADINGDLELEILIAERSNPGKLHIFYNDGTELTDGWPIELDGYPGVTPSIAYDYKNRHTLPNAGLVDNLIIMCSTSSIFSFDISGNNNTGFPVENSNTKFSYQSPLICKSWNNTQIIGASHGDLPEFYALNTNGDYCESYWPKPTVDDNWTYSPPTAIGLNGEFDFYIYGQPGADGTNPYPTIHAFNTNGEYLSGFPFSRTDGLEGFISAMYSTDLTKLYIFTGSNMKDESGFGYIHAYEADTDLNNFTEMNGFPIQVEGFTFMNGINLGDINNNGKLNLVALSYDQDFEITDSIHINIFEIENIDYNPDYCFGTYKGNNLRNGYVTAFDYNTKISKLNSSDNIKIYPSLISDVLNIQSNSIFNVEIYNTFGVLINKYTNCENNCTFNLQHLKQGMYFVKIHQNNKTSIYKVIKLK